MKHKYFETMPIFAEVLKFCWMDHLDSFHSQALRQEQHLHLMDVREAKSRIDRVDGYRPMTISIGVEVA